MDINDPKLDQAAQAGQETLDEAVATAPAAGIEKAEDKELTDGAQALLDEELMESEAEEDVAPATLESILSTAHSLLEKDPADFSNDELRRLRQQFSMIYSSAQEDQAPAQDVEDAEIVAQEDNGMSLRQQFDAVIEELRSRKAAWAAEQDAIRAENLRVKNEIIDQILAMAEDTDNVNRTFPQYRELQDKFNAVGEVDPTEDSAVWKRFQEAREKYSDNLKINKELRDYDFKKNLAEKEALLAEATVLAADQDVITAYRRLQDLHNKWRQIGPVAKELREDIWNRFRTASADINKRYQAYFEERKAREAENEAAKTAICERMEQIDLTTLNTFNAWEKATAQVLELQAEWKTLGFASKKQNRALFSRFRGLCDAFFSAKAEYFRNTREELNRNLAAKQKLTEEAETLATSTDWKNASERLIQLQKDWKGIGAVPKKYSDALWKRFTSACDAFFDAKKKANSGTRAVETANLKTKREIIGRLSALTTEETPREQAINSLRDLQKQWNETGHVPFREKDKLYQAYHEAVDAVRAHFELAERGARRARFEEAVADLGDDSNKIFRERERLSRALETRRAELRTYENNLSFLNSKSKSGQSLVKDMERRIERLKADIAELLDKVKVLDSKLS